MDKTEKDKYIETVTYRINNEIKYHGGNPPESVITLWSGYLAAIYENHIVSLDEYKNLDRLLPPLPNNPVVDLFTGRD